MNPKLNNNQNNIQLEQPFDDLMANLFVMVTDYSLSQRQSIINPIVERLNTLCRHSEVEHYPEQLKVLGKMRQLWRTRLFQLEHARAR